MKVAALDLGSNSFLLTIAEGSEKSFNILHDECQVTRLGQSVDKTRRFHPEALKRAEDTLRSFKKTIDKFEVKIIKAVSTSAARDVENGHLLLELGEKLGIPIEIISGDREAGLTFYGGIKGVVESTGTLVVDVGGGSTEYISDTGRGIYGKSLDIGSVRLTERFVTAHPINDKEMQKMSSYVREGLRAQQVALPKSAERIVAVAGTPTTLASMVNAMEFSVESVHKKVLSLSILENWLVRLQGLSVKDRLKIKGMQEGRADVIVAGLIILVESLKYYKLNELLVSCYGVRYGIIEELLKRAN